MTAILLNLCAIFYAVLCIFSIVTGVIYMFGKRKLNPLELSNRFMQKLDTEEKQQKFARKMGFVTFIVGIVQGATAFAIWQADSVAFYALALGFTLFSIASVSIKLKGKMNAFPIIKFIFYVAILIVLLLPSVRAMFMICTTNGLVDVH